MTERSGESMTSGDAGGAASDSDDSSGESAATAADSAVDDGTDSGVDDAGGSTTVTPETGRRELVGYAAGAGLGLGSFRAIDNVVLGYGVITGTNVVEQDLAEWAIEDFEPDGNEIPAGNAMLTVDGTAVEVDTGDTEPFNLETLSAAKAREADEEYGFEGGPIEELAADLPAIAAGDVQFEFSKTGPFFERVEQGSPRPYTTGSFRDATDANPEFVESFTGVDPRDPAPLIEGLAEAFREHSYYDVPRYAAGSVEDNVIFGRRDLRQHFETPTDFEALAGGENSGLFCTELTYRGIDAFHSVHPTEQSPPICCAYVRDERHKHAYLALATVLRDDGELVVPMTFVDYTYALLYDDLRLTWLLGEGIEAYTTRHRATEIDWNR